MTKIKINHITYELLETDRDSLELNGNVGMCYYDQQRIYLANTLSQDAKKDILWHELTHAILGEAKFNLILKEKLGEYYEVFVDSLADIYLRFMEDNILDENLIPYIKESGLDIKDINKLQNYLKESGIGNENI